ncbi:MAG: hypothetical protein RIS47_12 [Bacteroidota bacterium]|jgi:hypothetical protein
MKKFAILFALVLGFAVSTMADNVTPAKKSEVTVTNLSTNLVQVSVEKTAADKCKVKFYSPDFEIIHTEMLKDASSKIFDVTSLPVGNYIVKVELNGEEVYATVLKK